MDCFGAALLNLGDGDLTREFAMARSAHSTGLGVLIAERRADRRVWDKISRLEERGSARFC